MNEDTAQRTEAVDLARAMVAAVGSYDLEGLAATLDPNRVSFVTTADGGVRRIEGAKAFVDAFAMLDVATVQPRISLTQAYGIDPSEALVMIEVVAHRKGRDLHNFAAYLLRAAGGRITEIHMVEARPAESDAFWKA